MRKEIIGDATLLKPEQMPILRPVPMQGRELRKWEVMEDWWWYDNTRSDIAYGIKKGFIFDGASIPKIFRNILSPAGFLFLPGLIHDHLYRYRNVCSLEIYRHINGDGTEERREAHRLKVIETQEEADLIFKQVADSISPDNSFLTWIAYRALRMFGGFAWRKHRENEQ